MSPHTSLIRDILELVAAGQIPESVELAAQRLEGVTIGLRQKAPVLAHGARLFRVRKMRSKPIHKKEVGAPPAGVASLGRLNDVRQSVLYLADSPDTAFAEARAEAGFFCLSEWRIQPSKVVLANGGISLDLLHRHFPNEFDPPNPQFGGVEDEQVLALFQTLFTLPVGEVRNYYWSIAAGLASGFASICGRTSTETIDGNTKFTGRHPFSGIAYASMRKDKSAINFAFNDLGMTYLELDHVQWVERHSDGYFSGVDFAPASDSEGVLAWQGRPAHYQLPPGSAARITKVRDTVWNFELDDGGMPTFC